MQNGVYDQIKIPREVEPQDGDLLVYSKAQFNRLLQKEVLGLSFTWDLRQTNAS